MILGRQNNMKILYAPWREDYSRSNKKQPEKCVFCIDETTKDDGKNFILLRGKYSFVAMNLFPYNAGHLLVVPYQHKPHLYSLDQHVRQEVMELLSHSANILENKLKCEGLNVGLNCGALSGGSIPDHLHFHVVPRFKGDTNFLSVVGETKVISFDMYKMYRTLKGFFDMATMG